MSFVSCMIVQMPPWDMGGLWGTPDSRLPGVHMENFPLAAFFLRFQMQSGVVGLNLGFSYPGFYFENWSRYLGKCYPNISSSESTLRDTEEPTKAAVNSAAFKED